MTPRIVAPILVLLLTVAATLTALNHPARAWAAGCTIPANDITVTMADTTHKSVDKNGNPNAVVAGDTFSITTALSNLDGLSSGCTATVAVDTSTWGGLSNATTWINSDGTVSTTQQANSVAKMVLDAKSGTETFTTTDYPATHTGVNGHVTITSTIQPGNIQRGQTYDETATINGTATKVGSFTTAGPCGTTCPAMPTKALKNGAATADGSPSTVRVVSATYPTSGSKVTLNDTLNSSGQTINGVRYVQGFNCIDTWGYGGVTQADGTCKSGAYLSPAYTWSASNPTQVTVTTNSPTEYFIVAFSVTFTGNGPWVDTANLTGGGRTDVATATVYQYTVTGGGTGANPTYNPIVTTLVGAQSAGIGATLSDNVSIGATGGNSITDTWQVLGPIPAVNGSCPTDTASWSGAAVFDTGTTTLNGDGTTLISSTKKTTVAGCYSWIHTGPAVTGTKSSTTAWSTTAGVASETTQILPNPTINITKTVEPQGTTGPGSNHTLTVNTGDTVVFYYQVNNPASAAEALTNVTLSDNKCTASSYVSGDSNSNQQLDPGETWLYTCTQQMSATTTNVATATGTGTVTGKTVTGTDTDTVTVTQPSIDVAKTAGTVSTVNTDGTFTVTYTLSATNSTAAAGTYGPIVDNPGFPSGASIDQVQWQKTSDTTWTTGTLSNGTFPVGTSHILPGNNTDTYTVRITFHYTSSAGPASSTLACTTSNGTPQAGYGLQNTVTSVGETGGTSNNTACIDAPTPPVSSLTLTKKVTSVDDTNSDGINDAGDVIHYGFTVTNTGQVTLAPVTINDTNLSLSNWQCAATLAPGDSVTCAAPATHTITSSDITAGSVQNTATATGTPPYGDTVSTPPSTVSTPATQYGTLTVTKRDAGTRQPLTGAVFSLYQATADTLTPTSSTCTQATTGTAWKQGLTVGSDGTLTVNNLPLSDYDYTTSTRRSSGPWTVYCLVETKAPAGHELSAQPRVFTVTENNTAATVTVDDPASNYHNTLPATGGHGMNDQIPMLWTAGMCVMLTACGSIGWCRRRRN